jgi:hypothetical protein
MRVAKARPATAASNANGDLMNLSNLSRLSLLTALVAACGVAAACTSETAPAAPDSPPTLSDKLQNDTVSDDGDDAQTCAAKISQFNELEIVHPLVVNDPRASNATGGHWSFRFLVEQMAPKGTDPSDFVLALLKSWETPETVNGVTVAARTQIDSVVINPWLTASGGKKLDLAKAPFKLMAITNRLDLLAKDCSNAGEGRFVFGVTDQNGNALSFTMIFEYHLPTGGAVTPHVWAKRWHALHGLDITQGDGKTTYNDALQGITDLFSTRGSLPSAPNGNAISQVRSNEIALAGPWQLREFHLVDSGSGGFLVPATTAQSPTQTGLNDTATLHDFISDNAAGIDDGTVVFPPTYTDTIKGVKQTVSILGPNSDEDGSRWQQTDPVTKRNPNPIDATTLTNFSFLTCNGCHNLQNVQIGGFYHVDPFIEGNPKGGVKAGSERLSPFLLGNPNANPPIPSDLARRAKVMQGLLCQTSCPTEGLVSGPEGARVE